GQRCSQLPRYISCLTANFNDGGRYGRLRLILYYAENGSELKLRPGEAEDKQSTGHTNENGAHQDLLEIGSKSITGLVACRRWRSVTLRPRPGFSRLDTSPNGQRPAGTFHVLVSEKAWIVILAPVRSRNSRFSCDTSLCGRLAFFVKATTLLPSV